MQCSHPLLQTQATMTGREHLHLYARLRGVHPAARRAAMVERLLTQVMLLDGVSVCSSAGGEQQSDATLQAARGWARPPCRHFKNQSLCCLGSAFEEAALHTLKQSRAGARSIPSVYVAC
jgi:hypothetical protein